MPERAHPAALTATAAADPVRYRPSVAHPAPAEGDGRVATPDPGRTPVPSGKVEAPPLGADILERPRLLDWLAAKIHHRVVLVVAEAGYGKTTLLADFSRRSRVRTFWYRLDESDRDWTAFMATLVASGRRREPDFGARAASLLADASPGGPRLDAVVDAFLADLAAVPPDGTALILDDIPAVDDVPEIAEILRTMLAGAPERVTFVLSGRRAPSVGLGRLRARGEVAELGTETLRFDQRETDRLFRDVYRQPLAPDVAADLSRRTEGWAASLALVHTAVRGRDRTEVRRFVRSLNGAEGDLYDYLAEEVVGDLDADLQTFLMRTSVLETVTPELAGVAASLDETEAKARIARVEAYGLLVRIGGSSRFGHRYHPLVRDFLVHRLEGSVERVELQGIHGRIAAWAETRDWQLACRHHARAGDPASVVRVLGDNLGQIMSSGAYTSASAYLGMLPSGTSSEAIEIIRARTELQRGDAATARRIAADVLARFPDSEWATLNAMTIALDVGRVEEALDLRERLAHLGSDETLLAIADATHRLIETCASGNLGVALEAVEHLVRINEDRGQSHYLGISHVNAAEVLRAIGDAERTLGRTELAIELLGPPPGGIELETARLVRSWALAHLGRLEESRQSVRTARRHGTTAHAVESAAVAIDVETWYGSDDAAAAIVAETAWDGLLPDLAGLRILAELALALRRGDIPRATELAAALPDGPLRSVVCAEVRVLTTRAHLAVLTHAPDAAAQAEAARRLALRQGSWFWARYATVLLAVTGTPTDLNAHLAAIVAQDPAALSMLAELIFDRAAELSDDVVSAIEGEARRRPERWRPVLRDALANGEPARRSIAGSLLDEIGERSDIARLLKAGERLPARQGRRLGRRLARRLAPRVVIEDQGRIEVRIGGERVSGSALRRKVLALLCVLITRPAFAATRDEVLEALWPDAEPEVAVNSLNQTIYFLRRVFEPDFKEAQSPGYLAYDSEVIRLDPELVEARSARCRALIRAMGREPTVDEVERLVGEYRGRFALDFAYEEWAADYRDSLHAAYLRIVERELRRSADSGHYDRGIALAQRVIEVDPQADQIELALVRLYRLTGAHAAAAEQYGHYAGVMRRELGIEPAPLESV